MLSIRLSLRHNQKSTWKFAPEPYWAYADGDNLKPDEVALLLNGKRVLALVHGYNVEDALDAYARITNHIAEHYDAYLYVEWPGSRISLAFWLADMRADMAGRKLCSALQSIAPASLDIEGHSLGCRVTLEALRCGLRAENVLLTAPAVDNESICLGERYGEAVKNAARLIVAYSCNDRVLRETYKWAKWDDALGLTGPEPGSPYPTNVERWDLGSYIYAHGDYKRCGEFFERWRKLLTKQEKK
jgi:hypothetical protein